MKKRIIIIAGVILLIIILGFIIGTTVFYNSSDIVISDDYIVEFYGGASEVTYKTYVYKKGLEYKYINTQTSGMTGDDQDEIILKVGKIKKIEDVYNILDDNGSNSFAILPNDSKIYKIDEIKDILK